jgi:hypothetical protein
VPSYKKGIIHNTNKGLEYVILSLHTLFHYLILHLGNSSLENKKQSGLLEKNSQIHYKLDPFGIFNLLNKKNKNTKYLHTPPQRLYSVSLNWCRNLQFSTSSPISLVLS